MIQFVFFDFGGVLDSDGVHTRVLFWDAITKQKIFDHNEESRKFFQEAYTAADQAMMQSGSAKNMKLAEFNRYNFSLIQDFMHESKSDMWNRAADAVTTYQERCLKNAAETLNKIPLPKGIISNFTGNLEIILKENKLSHFFDHVTESFYIKSAKPDPHIFLTALSKVDFSPEEITYVGDNIVNDMEPAKELGLNTIFLAKDNKTCASADLVISSFKELEKLSWHLKSLG